MIKTECDKCGEFMWIEPIVEVLDTWWAGVEHDRLLALLDMRFEHVWECAGCGHFEPVYGRVRPQRG